MDAFTSHRIGSNKAIILVGYSDEETKQLQKTGLLPEAIIPRLHTKTGMYIMDKKDVETNESN